MAEEIITVFPEENCITKNVFPIFGSVDCEKIDGTLYLKTKNRIVEKYAFVPRQRIKKNIENNSCPMNVSQYIAWIKKYYKTDKKEVVISKGYPKWRQNFCDFLNNTRLMDANEINKLESLKKNK